MFGSRKLQEANAQLDALRRELDREKSARAEAEKMLSSVRTQVSNLEAQLRDTDLDALKEQAKETIAEYQGLKELYSRKINEFENGREEKEQAFARDAALQRHSLENEIRDHRQANQEYVASTVKTFSESYNYYLNQIKTLMDALGKVATRTGEALFEAENADLKDHFGRQMVEELKSGLDGMQNDEGDRILIGAAEEAVVEPQEEECCESAACESAEEKAEVEALKETEEACCEEAVEACCEEVAEDAEEACCEENADDTAETCCEEAAEGTVETAEACCVDAVEEAALNAEEACESAGECVFESMEEKTEEAAESAAEEFEKKTDEIF